ncbi:hypothetical protein PAMC26510_21495 [Caballeronia sordidicola]|uniref:Uncharacterized protein n=1 Tax=Caballeronia sordidicola TaxID=196367 RepID=A0A242MNR2_CABSO|nr:hypothetical protein PAMC26510_21495 [Caballeronia sordidicola]
MMSIMSLTCLMYLSVLLCQTELAPKASCRGDGMKHLR